MQRQPRGAGLAAKTCAEVGTVLGSLISRPGVILRTMYAQPPIAYSDPEP
jgi:hypothetical protein